MKVMEWADGSTGIERCYQSYRKKEKEGKGNLEMQARVEFLVSRPTWPRVYKLGELAAVQTCKCWSGQMRIRRRKKKIQSSLDSLSSFSMYIYMYVCMYVCIFSDVCGCL